MNKRTLLKLAIAVGLGNYLVYAIAAGWAGGDVLHGHIAGGRYFAATDGGFVEVGPVLFQFCRWQAYSLLLTFPLGLWSGFKLALALHDPNETVLSEGA